MLANDWRGMRADLEKTEDIINKHLNTFGNNTLKVINDKVFELQKQADRSWDLLIETKAVVEASTTFQ
jgi:hypothetical protein